MAARSHKYICHLAWTGASDGPTKSYAAYCRRYDITFPGKPPLAGSADPTFRGEASRHNPEDMLVAALSSCHALSYLALAALGGVLVVAYEDDAEGTMVESRGAGKFEEVILRPKVTIAAGGDVGKAIALHDKAHEACFIAQSVNFPVRCEPQVVVAQG